MRPLAPLLVLALLAGCAAPTATPPASGFRETAMPQATMGAEPSLAIAKDGTIFLAAPSGGGLAPDGVRSAAWLWRSRDGGASWDTLRAPLRSQAYGAAPFHSGDADVAVAPDGWTYHLDLQYDIASMANAIVVESSPDGGASWNATALLGAAGDAHDRPWLLPLADGRVGVLDVAFHASGGMSVEARWSTDHGASWSAPSDALPRIQESYFMGRPRDAGGAILLPYGYSRSPSDSDSVTAPSEVRVARSVDGGASWGDAKVADALEGFGNVWPISLDALPDGRALLAWCALQEGRLTLFVSESSDAGRSWSAPAQLPGGGTRAQPWAALRDDGAASVVWYGGTTTGDVANASSDAEWFVDVAQRDAGDGAWRVGVAIPRPVLTGPFCPRGPTCPAGHELLDFLSAQYAPDGKLHLAYARVESGVARSWHAS